MVLNNASLQPQLDASRAEDVAITHQYRLSPGDFGAGVFSRPGEPLRHLLDNLLVRQVRPEFIGRARFGNQPKNHAVFLGELWPDAIVKQATGGVIKVRKPRGEQVQVIAGPKAERTEVAGLFTVWADIVPEELRRGFGVARS